MKSQRLYVPYVQETSRGKKKIPGKPVQQSYMMRRDEAYRIGR